MSRIFSAVSKVTKLLPVVGALPQFLREPNELAVKLMRSSPKEVVPLPLGPATVYLVHHPDHLRHILLDNYQNYWKGPMFQRVDIMVGNGLVLSDGKYWRRQRKLMQPHFKPKHLGSLMPTLAGVVTERIARWRGAAEPIDVLPEMSSITMTVLLKWLFSFDIDEDMMVRFDELFTIVAKHVEVRGPTWFLPEWFPLPGRQGALKASAELRAMIGDIIDARRRSGRNCDDLLDMFLTARDDEGKGMTREQIIDEIQVIIFAGYDSTAAAMAWTWQLLATHPEAARRAQQEVHCVIPETGEPTLEQLGQLEYFERAFKEAIRLYPPFAFHPRSAREADVVGNQHIKPGDTLIYSNYAVHRNPDFWDHPDAFFPDHFLPKRAAARHRFAYVPFGAGPRVCIGMHMALLEAKVMFALALREFDIVRAHGNPQMMGRMGTSRPKDGIRIELRQRVRQQRRVQRGPSSHRERVLEPPPSYRDVVPPSYRILDHDVVPPSVRAAGPGSTRVPPSVRSTGPGSVRVPSSVRSTGPGSVRAVSVPPSVRAFSPRSSRSPSARPRSVPPSRRDAGASSVRSGSVPPSMRTVGPSSAGSGSLPPSVRAAASSEYAGFPAHAAEQGHAGAGAATGGSATGGCPFHQHSRRRSTIPPPSVSA